MTGKAGSVPFDFSGYRVLVAGGSRGIGRGIALGFAQAGAAVSICARGAAALEETRLEIAAHDVVAHAQSCDLAEPQAIEAWDGERVSGRSGRCRGAFCHLIEQCADAGTRAHPHSSA